MNLEGAKNDIKLLFFIVNFFIGLLPGFFLVAAFFAVLFGIAAPVYVGSWLAIPAFVGGMVLAITALGYMGAIRENRKMLYAYSGTMTLLVVCDIVLLAMFGGTRLGLVPALPLMHMGITILAGALACIMAHTARVAADGGHVLSPLTTSQDPKI